jgi:trehalose-phosphatase
VTPVAPARNPFAAKRLLQVLHASRSNLPPDEKRLRKILHARPLFENWQSVAGRLRKAQRVLLLLDFDGTLVGFKPKPEEVRLDAGLRGLLQRLARRPDVTVGFISGRRRADLRRRINVPGAQYWGLHGWEGAAGLPLNRGTRRKLMAACRLLEKETQGLKGIWIEDKQASIVLHYRAASLRDARQARGVMQRVSSSFTAELRILKGKKIWEMMPRELEGKGATVRKLAEKAGEGALVIYAGDDTTDESVFATLRRGITLHVGSNPHTQARFRVRNPEEVRRFLELLEEELVLRRSIK